VSARAVPQHVAAYAAALYHCGVGTWAEVAEMVSAVGLGSCRFDELARAATAWSRASIAPSLLRSLLKRLAKGQS